MYATFVAKLIRPNDHQQTLPPIFNTSSNTGASQPANHSEHSLRYMSWRISGSHVLPCSKATLQKARNAYQGFFAMWKDADPDIPILIEAKNEYESLK